MPLGRTQALGARIVILGHQPNSSSLTYSTQKGRIGSSTAWFVAIVERRLVTESSGNFFFDSGPKLPCQSTIGALP
jgi:hypothetical protein